MGETAGVQHARRECPCGGAAEGSTCPECGWPIDTRKPRRLILPVTLVPGAMLLLAIASIAIPYAVMPTQPPAAAAGETLPPSPSRSGVDEPAELILPRVDGMTEIEPYPEHVDGLNLQETAALDEEAFEYRRRLLEDLEFRRGAIRWWLVPEQRVLSVNVLEFADTEGAKAYMNDVALSVASDATVKPVWVPAPAAVAYGYDIPAEQSYGYQAYFDKSNRVYRVSMVNLDGKPGNEELLADVVEQQYVNG